MSEHNSEVFRHLSDVDASDETVTRVLDKLRKTPGVLRFSQSDWNTLRDKKPHVHRFIEAASFEAAPDDALLRETVSSALLGMIVLQQEMGLFSDEQRIADFIDAQFDEKLIDLFTDTSPSEPAA